MNYGKLAYLRLDEIENAISSFSTSTTKNYSANYLPNTIITADNSYSVAEISGDGVVNIIMTLDVVGYSSGNIELYLDDVLIGSCVATSTTRAQYTIMNTQELEGSGILRVRGSSDYMAELYNISLMVTGEGAYIKRSDIDVCMVESTNYCGCCYSNGSNMYIQKYAIDSGEASGLQHLCFSTTFDCDCDDEDNFYVVAIDMYGDFKLYIYDAENNVSSFTFSHEADSVAICECNKTLIIAFVKNSVCKYLEFDIESQTVSNAVDLSVSVTADDVAFVKNRIFPLMVINSSDKLLMIYSQPEYLMSGEKSVTISASLEVIE